MFLDLSEWLEFYVLAVSVGVASCLVIGVIVWAVWYLISMFKDTTTV